MESPPEIWLWRFRSKQDIVRHKTVAPLSFNQSTKLATEVFKTLHDFYHPYMKDIFKLKNPPYMIRGYFRMKVPMIDTTTYVLLKYKKCIISEQFYHVL